MTKKQRQIGLLWIWAAAMLLLLAACGSNAGSQTEISSTPSAAAEASESPSADPTGGESVELTISAAASLTDALGEIKTAYEGEHPDTKLSFNFGASGALQQQIENGAPADLFLSAASKNMQALVDGGLIDEGSQMNLLKNELVLVAATDAGTDIKQESDLTSDAVKKVAIGIPESVPAGAYAQEALTSQNLWDALQDKLVQGKDVRQVLQYVETGNADAGFVYKTDALTSDKVVIAATVDPASYTAVTYPIGIVKATAHPEQAEQFYSYLQSDEALDVFTKYGFSSSK